MKSIDTNINNPLSIGEIDLLRTVDSLQLPEVKCIKYSEYSLIQVPDPHTIYVITDIPGIMYYGSEIIKPELSNMKYLIGVELSPAKKYQFIIYMNQRDITGITSTSTLIPIHTYDDPQEAINALIAINNVGSHETLPTRIYSALMRYIMGELPIEDFLILCLSTFGFRDDPRLQKIIQMQVSYLNTYSRKDSTDLPIMLREEIKNQLALLKDNRDHSLLLSMYSDIYDVIVKYNFFKDSRYHTPIRMFNLAGPVAEICKIAMNSGVSRYVI